MAEKRVSLPFPFPNSPMKDGSEVPVKESTERWTDITLEDGTVFRIKPSVIGAVRIDEEFDQEGNPVYALRVTPTVSLVSSPDILKKKLNPSKVQ